MENDELEELSAIIKNLKYLQDITLIFCWYILKSSSMMNFLVLPKSPIEDSFLWKKSSSRLLPWNAFLLASESKK